MFNKSQNLDSPFKIILEPHTSEEAAVIKIEANVLSRNIGKVKLLG